MSSLKSTNVKLPLVKTATPNVFASPWKNSDLVLVVGETEFNVHRTILCLQSPVFEAMLNKDVEKEGKRDKITLEGKNPDQMCIFLKLLYPTNMLENNLPEEYFIQVLALAEEFKAVDVIKHCLSEAKITVQNALKILPFTSKYNISLREECIATALKGIPCRSLKADLLKLERHNSDAVLVGKCDLLERMLKEARKELQYNMQFNCKNFDGCTTQCLNFHHVDIGRLSEARKCELCLVAYRNKFCTIASSSSGVNDSRRFLELLKNIDDLAL